MPHRMLSTESKSEQLARVQQMADGDSETWDLSVNDCAALQGVLADREALLKVAQEFVRQDRVQRATQSTDIGLATAADHAIAAIAKAEGRS